MSILPSIGRRRLRDFVLPVDGASWAYDFTDASTLAAVGGRIAYAEDISGAGRPFVSSTRDCRPRLDTSGAFSYAEFLGATHDTGIVAPWADRAEVESFTFVFAWRSPASAQQPVVSNFGANYAPTGDGTQIYFGKNSGGPVLFSYLAAEPVNPVGVTVGSYGSGWIVALWEQSAKSSRAVGVDTGLTSIAGAYTRFRAFVDLLQWCREGTTASDFDVAFACCFPRQLNAYERAAMQRHAGLKAGRSL